jgi:hypothetical protein
MSALVSLLIIITIGVLVGILLFFTTRRAGATPHVVCLGSMGEPQALLAVSRLRSLGMWADVREVGGVTAISIELGSGAGYEVWVMTKDEEEAREVLGL